MLKLNFVLDEKADAALKKAGRETSISVVLLFMKDEHILLLGEPIPASGNMTNDIAKARDALQAAQLQSAYLVVYGGLSSPVTVIKYTSDSAKPKERMLYSSGSAHLCECVSKVNVARKTKVDGVQASTIEEIQPSLFKHKEDDAGREALMTESERFNAEVAKMPVAPQSTRMPGVSVPLSAEASQMLHQFAPSSGPRPVVVFKIEDNEIRVEQSASVAITAKNEQLESAQQLLRAKEPRYILLDYRKSAEADSLVTVMVYLCPETCPPKLKMTYASSKASFLEQVAKNGVRVIRNVEISSESEIPTAVHDAFVEVKYDDSDSKKLSSKPPGARGPRMLI